MGTVKLKRIIALLLVACMLLTCTGCSIAYDEDDHKAFMENPKEYMKENVSENDPYYEFWNSPLGYVVTTIGFELLKLGDDEKNIHLDTQIPESEENELKEDTVLLYYDTKGFDNVFKDTDWDYMTQNDNWFIEFTGFFSHTMANAKKHYKDAFRSYIKEFIIYNESRQEQVKSSFEEEKDLLIDFMQSLKGNVEPFLKGGSTVEGYVSAEEYEGFIAAMEKAEHFDEKLVAQFEDIVARTKEFAKTKEIKLNVEIKVPDSLKGAFSVAGKAVDTVSTVFEVAECIQSIHDVKKVQENAYLYFELEQIFRTIIYNTTNYYMKEAAREVLKELRGGEATDMNDYIVRKGANAIITINPYVAVVGGVIDTILVTATPLKDLDIAYSADAVRNIKMASCTLLDKYTHESKENIHYYDKKFQTEVEVYLMHCIQTQLVYTYVISDGKDDNQTLVEYARVMNIELPKNAYNYILDENSGSGK